LEPLENVKPTDFLEKSKI